MDTDYDIDVAKLLEKKALPADELKKNRCIRLSDRTVADIQRCAASEGVPWTTYVDAVMQAHVARKLSR